jgi:hypothetical protein
MSTKTSSLSFVPKKEFSLAHTPRLSGISQKINVSVWLLITIVRGMSWVLSLYALYLWDRVPAAESPLYFPDMTSESVQAHTDWRNTVLLRYRRSASCSHLSLRTPDFLWAKAVPALVYGGPLAFSKHLLCQPVSNRYILFTGRPSSIREQHCRSEVCSCE